MRLGDVEFEVVKEEGSAYGEVKHGNKTYIVADPGQEFKIRVRYHTLHPPDSGFPAGKDKSYYYRCSVEIDGKRIGFQRTLKKSLKCYETVIDGYIPRPGIRQPFKFAATRLQEDVPPSQQSSPGMIGTISVKVYTSYDSANETCEASYKAGPDGSTNLPNGKGKKALQAPSLVTAAGIGKTDPSATISNRKSYDVHGSIKGPLVIHYQTEDVLLLRKILDPTVPEHIALTSYAQRQDSGGDEEDAEEELPDIQIVPGTAEGSSGRAVKREFPSATTVVDLSGKRMRSWTEAPSPPIDLTDL